MQFFEPSGNRWRALFIDHQGRVLGASPPVPGLAEAQLAAERGVKNAEGVALVQVVQVRREGHVGQRTSSPLILP
jgi:hypothetical protein